MQLIVLYFSPVGSSKKVAEAIVSGMDVDTIKWVDLTMACNREVSLDFKKDDNVLMVFPVYAGRIVRIPRYMLKNMEGNGARVISVVSYGNRAFDDSLLELHNSVINAGFTPIGAAAFVCEHSFGIGLATNRPDEKDIAIAKDFGLAMSKIISDDMSHPFSDYVVDAIPGNYPPRTQFRHDFGGPLVPTTSEECIECMTCSQHCPVGAISDDNPYETNAKKCITCFRCIRHCPKSARDISLEDFKKHTKWLGENYQERLEPCVFIGRRQ